VLTAITKKRAYEDIVKQIRSLIEKGRLKKDDQLPSERELSETLKVSRATVREAVIALEGMKLLERRHGNGTYVICSSEDTLIQPLAAALIHEKDDLVDIFYLRKILEPGIAQLAAENATAEEIAELEGILREQEETLNVGQDPVRNDTQYHHVLARMSRKRVLQRLFLALVDLLAESRERYGQTDERKQKSVHGHHNILAAIKNGDGVAARKAMRHHLEEVEGSLFQKSKGGRRKP